MYNPDVIEHIATTIKGLFPGKRVVREEQVQGQYRPDTFRIRKGVSTVQGGLADTRAVTVNFDLAYFPNDNNSKERDMNVIDDVLCNSFNFIHDADENVVAVVNGGNGSVIDGVYHYEFSITYKRMPGAPDNPFGGTVDTKVSGKE